jgi:hypothetical protein
VVGSKTVVLIVSYAGSPAMRLTQHSSQ